MFLLETKNRQTSTDDRMLSVMIRPEADTAAADWTHMKAQSTNLETDTFGLKQVFKQTKQNKKTELFSQRVIWTYLSISFQFILAKW